MNGGPMRMPGRGVREKMVKFIEICGSTLKAKIQGAFSGEGLRGHRPFLWLFAISFFYHVFYIYFTGLDLAPDEAHYWEWSRRLGLSYYSKGPGVAYIIAFFTSIFGDTPFGVRLGSVVLSQITLLAAYWLTWKMFETRLTAFLAAIMIQLFPLFAAGSVVMTTDSVYITFWALCVWAVYMLVRSKNPRYFYLIGIFTGLGFLGKYTMILICVCFLVYFLSSRKRRALMNHSAFYLSLISGFIIILPVLIWTIRYDFINLMHVLYQGKNQSTSGLVSLKYFFEFVGGQAGAVTPLLFGLMIWASVKALRMPAGHRWKEHFVLLSCFGLPVFVIFLVMSFKMRIHPNWPAACYFSMIVLTAGICTDTYNSLMETGRKTFRKFLYWTFGIAAFILVLAYNTDGIRLIGMKLLPEEIPTSSLLLKPVNRALAFFHDPKKDPTNRLKGWRELGLRIDEIMSNLDEDNTFIFSSQYQVAGEIAFYTKKKYRTYCINFGRRLNQYDIWGGWDNLIGKDAIQVEDTRTTLHNRVAASFEHCELLEYFEAKRVGKVIKDWSIFICTDFKGLEEEDRINSY